MATILHAATSPPAAELHSGDRLTREEFHRVYQTMGPDFHAELIGGIVYVSSPLKRRHGRSHLLLARLFAEYEEHTPGVEAGDNTTILLGDDSEPQPDLYLLINPGAGGQSRVSADDYVAGPPELVAEIAHSSRAIDLHAKLDDYARFGVLEYVVVNVLDGRVHWFDLRTRRELSPDTDGVCRIRAFPGLWIDGHALLLGDSRLAVSTLRQGLATPEHAEFVQRLRGSDRAV